MVRQAGCDAEAEDAKALLRPTSGGCGLLALFKVLDPQGKSYILDTDLLQLCKEHEAPTSFASLCALVHEVDIRRGGPLTGRISFRDLGTLVFPIDSKEFKALSDSSTDAEAKSVLYLLQFTEPCPRCGMRVQRDADATACPNVVCPCHSCQTPFRCYLVGRDNLYDGRSAMPADRFTLCKLVAAAARTAENLELDRKRLASEPGFDHLTLKSVFAYISAGASTIGSCALRQAFRDQHVPVSEKELDLMWQRYAPHEDEEVTFEHFLRQLRYDPMWTPEDCHATNKILMSVLQTVVRQATSDSEAEDAKALLPKGCPLPALFRTLDPYGKGYLMDTDFWQLVQDFRGSSSFGSICAMLQEIQLRRRYDQLNYPGRLSMREFGALIFPLGSPEYKVTHAATSDVQAKSELYLMQNSDKCPNPKCGVRVQRDSDSSGCPEVECPLCCTPFLCTKVVGDRTAIRSGWDDETGSTRLSVAARQQLHRAIAAQAHAADELEKDRLRLAQLLGYDATGLSDVFNFVAQGRTSFSLADLRRTLCHLHIKATERDLDLVWKRYAPSGSATVTFPDFIRQLKPLNHGLGGA